MRKVILFIFAAILLHSIVPIFNLIHASDLIKTIAVTIWFWAFFYFLIFTEKNAVTGILRRVTGR